MKSQANRPQADRQPRQAALNVGLVAPSSQREPRTLTTSPSTAWSRYIDSRLKQFGTR